MRTIKPLRLLGAATLLSVSALAAMAQTTPPAPSSPPAEKPPMNKPDAAPKPQATPAPAPAPQKPSAAAKNEKHPMVGRNALSSDGSKVGDVRAVKTGPDGKVTALQVKVGGFLGFGGKIVEVASGKFTEKGDTIQLGYTSDELSKLPEVKDAS
jgi:hypothetical protein